MLNGGTLQRRGVLWPGQASVRGWVSAADSSQLPSEAGAQRARHVASEEPWVD